MTAKEKAEELFELFTFSCRECYNAKESALRAVDEVIKANPYKWVHYWIEVKKEIKKL